MILFLKILGGVIALGYGIYLGMGGQYRSDPDELDEALGPGGRTRKVKRHFTPLGWLRKTDERGARVRRMQRGRRRRFEMVVPKARPMPPEVRDKAGERADAPPEPAPARDETEGAAPSRQAEEASTHPGAPRPKEVAPEMKEVLPDFLKRK